jgi:NAD(P)-dependent dehydrogenase (short-subunit alcohol dehydrogenase family)
MSHPVPHPLTTNPYTVDAVVKLRGKGAIVAGTRRIGAAIVRRLAVEGVNPAILYRNDRAGAEALADDVKGRVERVAVIQADLTIEADVKRAVADAKRQLGDLSFCVNLAGDYPRAPFSSLNAAAWEAGLAAARGTYLLAVHAARAMLANPGPTRGHLIFFGDWAAEETPYLDYLPYLAGKAAVHFLTRAFAVELAQPGILVNAIAPGPTDPPRDLSPDGWAEAIAQTPLGRESSEADIAELVVALLKLETVTGETIRVDSGRHLAGTAKRRPGR